MLYTFSTGVFRHRDKFIVLKRYYLGLREEYTLYMLRNKVAINIYGPKVKVKVKKLSLCFN